MIVAVVVGGSHAWRHQWHCRSRRRQEVVDHLLLACYCWCYSYYYAVRRRRRISEAPSLHSRRIGHQRNNMFSVVVIVLGWYWWDVSVVVVVVCHGEQQQRGGLCRCHCVGHSWWRCIWCDIVQYLSLVVVTMVLVADGRRRSGVTPEFRFLMDRSGLLLSFFHTCPLPNNFSEVEGCGAALASIFDPAKCWYRFGGKWNGGK